MEETQGARTTEQVCTHTVSVTVTYHGPVSYEAAVDRVYGALMARSESDELAEADVRCPTQGAS
jgi:hypothetical protein